MSLQDSGLFGLPKTRGSSHSCLGPTRVPGGEWSKPGTAPLSRVEAKLWVLPPSSDLIPSGPALLRRAAPEEEGAAAPPLPRSVLLF